LAISYLLVPVVLIWFYRSKDTRSTFEARDPNSYWVESVPVPVLVLGLLMAFYAVALHIPIFFNGLFPLFGEWINGLQGIAFLAVSILLMLFLAWGLVRLKTWAWWGSLTLLAMLTVSSVLTLSRSGFSDILAAMRFPPTEMDLLSGIPIEGLHLAPFVGIPPLASIALLLYSGRYFRAGRNRWRPTTARLCPASSRRYRCEAARTVARDGDRRGRDLWSALPPRPDLAAGRRCRKQASAAGRSWYRCPASQTLRRGRCRHPLVLWWFRGARQRGLGSPR
jgi:hypothetical protein